MGEAAAKRKINRDKREEGGVADQPFLSYGVPTGTAKEKKKPGREREWRRVCVAGGVGGERETRGIYYCLRQQPREPGRGAEARGGGQRTIRST